VPIYRLLERQAFEPEHCQAMTAAYEAVLQELGLNDRNDPLCEIIARTIIACGQQGIRDPNELHRCALDSIRGVEGGGPGDLN
jgi:hypothetical protein